MKNAAYPGVAESEVGKNYPESQIRITPERASQ